MLRLATHDLAILAPACNPQELSNSVWALAKLGAFLYQTVWRHSSSCSVPRLLAKHAATYADLAYREAHNAPTGICLVHLELSIIFARCRAGRRLIPPPCPAALPNSTALSHKLCQYFDRPANPSCLQATTMKALWKLWLERLSAGSLNSLSRTWYACCSVYITSCQTRCYDQPTNSCACRQTLPGHSPRLVISKRHCWMLLQTRQSPSLRYNAASLQAVIWQMLAQSLAQQPVMLNHSQHAILSKLISPPSCLLGSIAPSSNSSSLLLNPSWAC